MGHGAIVGQSEILEVKEWVQMIPMQSEEPSMVSQSSNRAK